MWIASFDPGLKNLAFSIEELPDDFMKKLKIPAKNNRLDIYGEVTKDYKTFLKDFFKISKTILFKKVDLNTKSENPKVLDRSVFLELTKVLDEHKDYWNKCSYVVIEQQMSFGKNINVTALKISQHVYSYFIFYHGIYKEVFFFPAYNKTQLLGAPKKLSKPERKKWSVAISTEIWIERDDKDSLKTLSTYKKKDDVCDCLIMNLAFIIYHLIDNKKLN